MDACEKFADFMIVFVRSAGADQAYACEEHLQKVLLPALQGAKGHAARVSRVPADSQEPCEFGVE